jgi:hypothetical protein
MCSRCKYTQIFNNSITHYINEYMHSCVHILIYSLTLSFINSPKANPFLLFETIHFYNFI